MACWGWPDWASACWLLCCAASASDCPGTTAPTCIFWGRWGPGGGQAALPAPPPAPAGCGAAPALGGARGVLCPLSLRRHGVLRRLFRRCGGGLGGGQIFKAPPVRLLPVLVPALPLVHAVGRVGCFAPAAAMDGRLRPLGHSIHSRHCRAQRRALLPVQLWEAGAELVIFAFLLWYAGRAAGPGQMLRAYVFCYAPVRFVLEWFRGDPARGMYGPLHVSVAQLGCSGLGPGVACGGAEAQKYVRERVSQQRATETRAIQRIHKNHRKEETARADAPKRAAGSGCLNFRFHDSRRTFRQDLFYI